MVIYSKEVQNALNDIWLYATLNDLSLKTYLNIRDKLDCLDKRYINRQQSQYHAWRHLGLFEIDFRHHHFGYSWDGTNAVVEYYYNSMKKESVSFLNQLLLNNSTKINTMKNKKVIRLTESDLHNVIKESVQQVLMEVGYKSHHNAALAANKRLIDKFPQAFDSWYDPFKDEDESYKDNPEFKKLSQQKIKHLQMRDADFIAQHPGVADTRRGEYYYNSPCNVNGFSYDFNNGKNSMHAHYSRPDWAYYTDDYESYEPRWNEKRYGKGRKSMTPEEKARYEKIKQDIGPAISYRD